MAIMNGLSSYVASGFLKLCFLGDGMSPITYFFIRLSSSSFDLTGTGITEPPSGYSPSYIEYPLWTTGVNYPFSVASTAEISIENTGIAAWPIISHLLVADQSGHALFGGPLDAAIAPIPQFISLVFLAGDISLTISPLQAPTPPPPL